jgi:hypothetical protein
MNKIISKEIFQNYSLEIFFLWTILCSLVLTTHINAHEYIPTSPICSAAQEQESIQITDTLSNSKEPITVNLETYYWLQKKNQVNSIKGGSSKSLIGLLDYASRMLGNINKIILKLENHQDSEIINILSEILYNLEGILDKVENLSDSEITNSNYERSPCKLLFEVK